MSDPIFVVEDNDDLLLLFRLVLESAGYQVLAFDNGRDALEHLEYVKPQLVLMDIMMPEMSGLQLATAIRQQEYGEHLPIVFVSAIDRLKDELLQKSQANGIIYKPFNIDDLLIQVDSYLTCNPSDS